MSTPETLPRPPQVTMLGWMILVGSLLVVVNVFETLSGLRSLETRDLVEEYLVDGPGSSLGWSVETGIAALRVTAMVAAGCAAGAAVLGWFVLRRHRGARVALTVLAVPLFLTGAIAGGFLSSLVAASVVLLWVQPARDWFNGLAPRPATPLGRDDSGARNPFERVSRPQEPSQPDAPPAAPTEPTAGRPVQGFGDRPTWQTPPVPPQGQPQGQSPQPGRHAGQPGPQGQQAPEDSPYGHTPGSAYGAPVVTVPEQEARHTGQPAAEQPAAQGQHDAAYAGQHHGQPHGEQPAQPWASPEQYGQPGQPAYGQPWGQAPTQRPAAVVWAAVLTWIFAGIALVSSALAVLVLLVAPDQLRGEIDRMLADVEQQGGQQVTADMLITTTAIVGVVLAVFCLVACLAALLLVLRRAQGAVLLMITAAFCAAFFLLGGIAGASPVLLVPAVAAIVVIVLLRRRDVRAWLGSR